MTQCSGHDASHEYMSRDQSVSEAGILFTACSATTYCNASAQRLTEALKRNFVACSGLECVSAHVFGMNPKCMNSLHFT